MGLQFAPGRSGAGARALRPTQVNPGAFGARPATAVAEASFLRALTTLLQVIKDLLANVDH